MFGGGLEIYISLSHENDVSGHVWSITMIQAVVKRIYSTHNNLAKCRNCKGI